MVQSAAARWSHSIPGDGGGFHCPILLTGPPISVAAQMLAISGLHLQVRYAGFVALTNDPNIYWTDLFMTVGRKFAQINLFRRLAKAGILQGVPTLFNENDTFLRYLESEESGWVIPDPKAAKAVRQEMLATLTQSRVNAADSAVDAACLVFAHSVADVVVSDAVRLVGHIAPDEWMSFLENRKVSLKDVRDMGFAKAYASLLDWYIEDLCKDSLAKRIDVLNQKCQPCPPILMPPDRREIVYDRDRLERLDKTRQEIIHRVQTDQPIPNLDGDLEYLREVSLYVLMIVRHRFKLDVDLGHLVKMQAAPEEAASGRHTG